MNSPKKTDILGDKRSESHVQISWQTVALLTMFFSKLKKNEVPQPNPLHCPHVMKCFFLWANDPNEKNGSVESNGHNGRQSVPIQSSRRRTNLFARLWTFQTPSDTRTGTIRLRRLSHTTQAHQQKNENFVMNGSIHLTLTRTLVP